VSTRDPLSRSASWWSLAAQVAALVAVAFALSFGMQTLHLRALVRPDIPGLPQPQMRDLMRVGLLDLSIRTALRALLIGALPATLVLLVPRMRRRWSTLVVLVWAAATLAVLGVMVLTL
jgi:sterol desaturase/sphingolipid hydroxylase (fatty acid hydroxylase superfamily)